MTARAKLQLKPAPPVSPVVEAAPETLAEKVTPRERPDRDGKKIIAGHFPKATWKRFRLLSTNMECTAQELLEEALSDLFQKYRV
jgi:hypothetical protein